MTLRNVYFDSSTIVDQTNPIIDGIRRATREMFSALSSKKFIDNGIRVIPIVFDGFTAKVNYSAFFKELDGFINSPIDGREVLFKENDVLFIPAFDIFVPERHFNFQHLPAFVKIVTVIHDLLPIRHVEWFPKDSSSRFKSAVDNQLFYSDHLIVSSKKVRDDLLAYISVERFLLNESNISVLPLVGLQAGGQSKLSEVEVQDLVVQSPPPGEIRLLAVGTIEPRKGHFDILMAFFEKAAEHPELILTFVGRLGWDVEKELSMIKKALKEYPGRFFWHQDTPDAELEAIYKISSLCLAASFDEGFGLPVIEALRRNIPVLGRGIEVFLEISDGRIVTFGEGMDFDNLQSAFQNISEAIEMGHDRLKSFRPRTENDFISDLLGILQKDVWGDLKF